MVGPDPPVPPLPPAPPDRAWPPSSDELLQPWAAAPSTRPAPMRQTAGNREKRMGVGERHESAQRTNGSSALLFWRPTQETSKDEELASPAAGSLLAKSASNRV